MEHDDKIRSKNGVVVCLRDMGNGTSRLYFDDVKADREVSPVNWAHSYFCTFTPELANAELESMNLSEAMLKQIGVAVVARLLVLNGRGK